MTKDIFVAEIQKLTNFIIEKGDVTMIVKQKFNTNEIIFNENV